MKVPSKKTKEDLLIELSVCERERDAEHEKLIQAIAMRDKVQTAFDRTAEKLTAAEEEIYFLKSVVKSLMER